MGKPFECNYMKGFPYLRWLAEICGRPFRPQTGRIVRFVKQIKRIIPQPLFLLRDFETRESHFPAAPVPSVHFDEPQGAVAATVPGEAGLVISKVP